MRITDLNRSRGQLNLDKQSNLEANMYRWPILLIALTSRSCKLQGTFTSVHPARTPEAPPSMTAVAHKPARRHYFGAQGIVYGAVLSALLAASVTPTS